MLSPNYLSKLVTKYQTSELNVRREYAQHLLLSYLYQQEETNNLYFKGGTALRLIYKSPRFSEDLDFDTDIHKINIWEKVMESMLIAVSREGVDVDVQESTETSGGYLAIITVKNIGELVKIQFEISFRKNSIAGEVFSIDNDFVPSYPLRSLSASQLVEGKLHALFDRHKARDFYDLYFLLRANLLTVDQKRSLVDVKKLLEKTKMNFNRELSLFLPRSQSLIIRNFDTTLLHEIDRNI